MMDPKKKNIAFFYPETTKNWKKINLPKVLNNEQFHENNFVRPHKKGKDAGTDFFDNWSSSNSRIYDLFKGTNWKPRKHKRKVIKPEHNTEDNFKNCGCGCWYSLCLPPFEEKERFVYYEGLYSLILLFNKHRK